jgi:hypothetical protein
MAKSARTRFRRRKQHDAFIWTVEEAMFLLAWADQCVRKNYDFNNTILRQLMLRWPERKPRLENVEKKLYRLWSTLGRYGSTWRDIVVKGTECLDMKVFGGSQQKEYANAVSYLER